MPLHPIIWNNKNIIGMVRRNYRTPFIIFIFLTLKPARNR